MFICHLSRYSTIPLPYILNFQHLQIPYPFVEIVRRGCSLFGFSSLENIMLVTNDVGGHILIKVEILANKALLITLVSNKLFQSFL